MKIKQLYICDICGNEYIYKEFAEYCEASSIKEQKLFKPGYKVLVRSRYNGLEPDEIVGVRIGPTVIARFLSNKIPSDLNEDFDYKNESFHESKYRTKGLHQIGKDLYEDEFAIGYLHHVH